MMFSRKEVARFQIICISDEASQAFPLDRSSEIFKEACGFSLNCYLLLGHVYGLLGLVAILAQLIQLRLHLFSCVFECSCLLGRELVLPCESLARFAELLVQLIWLGLRVVRNNSGLPGLILSFNGCVVLCLL